MRKKEIHVAGESSMAVENHRFATDDEIPHFVLVKENNERDSI